MSIKAEKYAPSKIKTNEGSSLSLSFFLVLYGLSFSFSTCLIAKMNLLV